MMIFSILIPFTTLIPAALMMISTQSNWNTNKSREKSSPYECGFDPNSDARTPFSIRFFLLIILFLIFDIEVALLIPIPFISKFLSMSSSFYPMSLFLMILILGLIHEWNEGSLSWMH